MIKAVLIHCLLLISFLPCSAQKDREPFFFNEIHVSLNRSFLANENTIDKMGAGFALYKVSENEKTIKLVCGIEYNFTQQLKKEIYENRYSYSENVTYSISNISLPIGIRAELFNEKRVFAEINGFLDLITGGKRKGIMHSFIPDQNNNIFHTELAFKEKVKLSTLNFGFSPSIGCIFPILKQNKLLVLKIEYKWGLMNLFSTYTGQDVIYNKYFRMNIGLNF